jgi:hypothetical protein
LNNKDFFKLNDLKDEAKSFCEKYGLDATNFIDVEKWHSFLRLMLEIIKDSPIIIGGPIIEKITLVGRNIDEYAYKFNLVGTNEAVKVKLKLKKV